MGNAATTAEAWISPLTPGALGQRPVETDRTYLPGRSPTRGTTAGATRPSLVPERQRRPRLGDQPVRRSQPDARLLVLPRLHRGQLQPAGRTTSATAPGPLPTAARATRRSATSRPARSPAAHRRYLGRDNANQITLQDGVPGITNQYLFQPIAGAFYAPCVDGDFDMRDRRPRVHPRDLQPDGRRARRRPHRLPGRLDGRVAGATRSALEYLIAHGYCHRRRPTRGSSARTRPATPRPASATTRSTTTRCSTATSATTSPAPRSTPTARSWSAVDVRRPPGARRRSTTARSRRRTRRSSCAAQGAETRAAAAAAANQCPGNRRWIQLMFDAFLLQQPGTSMLDARDAFLAADVMRFDGANQAVIWNGLRQARHGPERRARHRPRTTSPTPDYTSPLAQRGHARDRRAGLDEPGRPPVKGKLYVGQYEARVTPIADTDPATPLGRQVELVPGTLRLRVPGRRLRPRALHRRPSAPARPSTGCSTCRRNLASATNGAMVDGASAGSLNTELAASTTPRRPTGPASTRPASASTRSNPFVNVDLAGAAEQLVRSVQVSALLRPGRRDDRTPTRTRVGSRFTALRQFAIETCTAVRDQRLLVVLPAAPRLAVPADLHEPGQRLPGDRAAAARAGPALPDLRRARHVGHPRAAGRPGEPVHRARRQYAGRAGRRPAQRHRLHSGVDRGRVGAGGGAAGVRLRQRPPGRPATRSW